MSRPKRKGPTRQAPPSQEPLVAEQYGELNATLYASKPSDYLRSRLRAIILTLQEDPDENQAEDASVHIGSLEGGPSPRPSKEVRLRYAALDTSVLLHHAGETLVRLSLAHETNPPCPWITISDFRDFRRFKEEATKLATRDPHEFDRSSIAAIFLGGATQPDAGTDFDEEVRKDAVSGFIALLQLAAERITSDKDLYNAAKHGLVGIPALHGTHNLNGFDIAKGLGITYLETMTSPTPDEGEPQKRRWATTTFVGLDANLMSIELFIRGIHSLWAVASRKYAGLSGEIVLVSRDSVLTAKSLSVVNESRLVHSISQSLPTYHRDATGQLVTRNVQVRLAPTGVGEEEVAALNRFSTENPPAQVIPLLRRVCDPDPMQGPPNSFFHFTGTS